MIKVDRETAESEFNRVCAARRLSTDTAGMPQKDREAFAKNKQVIVSAIEDGHMVVDEQGQPTLKLHYPVEIPGKGKWETLTFYRPKGAMLTATDGLGDNDNGARMHAMLGSVCKVSRPVFDELDWEDHKVCAAVFVLFLA